MAEVRLAIWACRRAAEGLDGAVVLPCAGRLAAGTLVAAFAAGADGVAVRTCGESHHGCRFDRGAARAEVVAAQARDAAETLGIDPRRVAAADSSEALAGFRRIVAELGPLGAAPADLPAAPGLDGWMRAVVRLNADPALSPRRPDEAGVAALAAGERCDTLYLDGAAGFAERFLAELLPAGKAPAVGELFRRAGRELRRIPDERIAGGGLLAAGDLESFRALAHRNAARWAGTGAKRIVTQCVECSRTLADDYPAHGATLAAEVLCLPQALAEAGVRVARRKAAWLAPCAETPGADVLYAGLKRVEASGPLHPARGWLGGAATRRAAEALARTLSRAGIETLHATCPRCALALRLAWREGAWRHGSVRVTTPARLGTGDVEVNR